MTLLFSTERQRLFGHGSCRCRQGTITRGGHTQRLFLPPSSFLRKRSFLQRRESDVTPNERCTCTPPRSSCLQGPHAFSPLQDPKVQPAPAYPTSERTFPLHSPVPVCP